MPSTVLVYVQLGQFLMVVMAMSWFFATFFFQSMCAVAGPRKNFGQLSITKLCRTLGLCKGQSEETPPELETKDVFKNPIIINAGATSGIKEKEDGPTEKEDGPTETNL